MRLTLLLFITGAASFGLTAAVRAYAVKREILDRPNARSSHTVPTPRGGGLAVLIASSLGLAMGIALDVIDGRVAFALGGGMLVLGAVGWADDTRGLRASVRLAVHLAVACWTLYMLDGMPVVRFGGAAWSLGIAGYAAGALGIVWSINLFNFMDGIDGLAGSQSVLIFGTGALLLWHRGNYSLGAISAILAAAAAGFLPWNWPTAKIFLGDVGSGAIGYLIAGLAIASENDGSVPLIIFAILGGVFVLDATVTLVRRFVRGDRLSDAHRDHAYQRMAREWRSHRSVTVAAGGATLVLAALGTVGTVYPLLLLPSVVVGCLLLGTLLIVIERRAPM